VNVKRNTNDNGYHLVLQKFLNSVRIVGLAVAGFFDLAQ
jgi:hypothetical protein